MKARIHETQEIKDLELIDPRTGVDNIVDFINYGIGDITYNGEEEIYECDKETYDWWANRIAEEQQLLDIVYDLQQRTSYEIINEIVEKAQGGDFETDAAYALQALDEIFGDK